MDFLDPAKKRKHGKRLFIGYILVGIGITLAALILLSLAYGYTVDRKTGNIIQNGIVFVASAPSDAQISFNGQPYKDATDTRAVLPSADYHVEIKKNGYRTWQRDFFLAGGSIERFVYPRLFPEEIRTSDMATYRTAPAFTSQSPDRRWLLVQPVATEAKFEVYDLEQDAPIAKAITLPTSVVKDGTKSFELVEWSTDNRRVLLKHIFGKQSEYVVLDREEPSNSININETVDLDFHTVSLRDKKYDQWYLHNTSRQNLYIASRTDPEPELLIEDVAAYKTHGSDIVLYASTARAAKGKARIMIREENRSDLLREVTASKRYLLDVARFDNQWFFAVGAVSDGKIYIYREPFTAIQANPRQTPVQATIMRLENPEFISFSQNTRFIAVQAQDQFTVYDAETKRVHRYDAQLGFKAGQKAVWMDGHRLSGVLNGQVTVFDYDGINKQQLMSATEVSLPYFTPDYERLFTVAPKQNSKEANLVSGRLVLE